MTLFLYSGPEINQKCLKTRADNVFSWCDCSITAYHVCTRNMLTEQGFISHPVEKTSLRLQGSYLLIWGENWCFEDKVWEQEKGCNLSRGRAVPEASLPICCCSLCICACADLPPEGWGWGSETHWYCFCVVCRFSDNDFLVRFWSFKIWLDGTLLRVSWG